MAKRMLYFMFLCASLLSVAGCASQSAFNSKSVGSRIAQTSHCDENMVVVISDRRRDAQESARLFASIAEQFRHFFPSAELTIIPEDQYLKKSYTRSIVVRVQILECRGGVGGKTEFENFILNGKSVQESISAGKWHGLVGIKVAIVDHRDNCERRYFKNLGYVVSESTVEMKKDFRATLAQAYQQTMLDVLLYVDRSLNGVERQALNF